MQYRPILNIGFRPNGDGFGIVSSNGGGEPDRGVFVEDYVANDGGVGCYPGCWGDARDVGSEFVHSFHRRLLLICLWRCCYSADANEPESF